jgi:hypothetical protein
MRCYQTHGVQLRNFTRGLFSIVAVCLLVYLTSCRVQPTPTDMPINLRVDIIEANIPLSNGEIICSTSPDDLMLTLRKTSPEEIRIEIEGLVEGERPVLEIYSLTETNRRRQLTYQYDRVVGSDGSYVFQERVAPLSRGVNKWVAQIKHSRGASCIQFSTQ